MFGLDILASVANVVYLASYSVRDILWLRIFSIVGGALLLPYYYLQVNSLWTAIAWNLVFISINAFWVVKLFMERRPVHFNEEERRLRESALRHVDERDARRLFDMGKWTTVPKGTVLLSQGHGVTALTLLSTGKVKVLQNDAEVDTLEGGRFLGSAAYLSKDEQFVAPVTVEALEPTRSIVWQFKDLQKLGAGNLELKADIESSLGQELTRFLQTARSQLPQLRMH